MISHSACVAMVAVVLTAISRSYAADSAGLAPEKNFEVSGGISFQAIQIRSSTARPRLDATDSTFLNGAWIQDIGAGFALFAQINPRLTINTGLRGSFWHPLQTNIVGYASRQTRRASFGVSAASGTYTAGDPARPALEITGGYFGYNYAPEQHNFGGYLVRNAVYPGFLFSGGAGEGFTGLRLRSNYVPHVDQNLLLSTEIRWLPYFDFSLAYIADFAPGPFLNIGAGVNFYRLISVNGEMTTATTVDRYTSWNMYSIDTVSVEASDTVLDTTYYSHAGTKLMLRFVFDGKALFGLENLGQEDLKLYAEAAILGLKDYPLNADDKGYPDIGERIPVMAGLTLPSHPASAFAMLPVVGCAVAAGKAWPVRRRQGRNGASLFALVADSIQTNSRSYVAAAAVALAGAAGSIVLERIAGRAMWLDEVAVEMEWYGSPYKNNPYNDQSPLPRSADGDPHRDDWRWAVYAGKTLYERISISVKAASDHLRTVDENGWPEAREWLLASDQWAWSMNLGIGF